MNTNSIREVREVPPAKPEKEWQLEENGGTWRLTE